MPYQYTGQANSMDEYQRKVAAFKADREAAQSEYNRLRCVPDARTRLSVIRELIRRMNIEATYREQGWPSHTGQRQDSGHIGWIISLRGQISALEWEEATIMQSAGVCNAQSSRW